MEKVAKGSPTIVLTGATSGIGLAAARLFARDGGRLILHGRRPPDEVEPLLRSLRLTMPDGGQLYYLQADFSQLSDVARLAREIDGLANTVDLLINNAGRPGPSRRTLTADGNEVTFQVNYLAPVALTTMLLPLIGTSSPGRIVNVASTTHYSASLDLDDLDLRDARYSAYDVYANSKLALVIYSCWLGAHPPRPQLEVVSMHPGVIATKLLAAGFSGRGDAPEAGGENVHFVATRHGDQGAYYEKRRRVAPNSQASDPAIQDKLQELTMALLRFDY